MTFDPVSDHERLEELIRRVQRLERDMDELRKVVRRIESNIHSSSVQRDIRGQGPVLLPRRPTDPKPIGPAVPPPQRREPLRGPPDASRAAVVEPARRQLRAGGKACVRMSRNARSPRPSEPKTTATIRYL